MTWDWKKAIGADASLSAAVACGGKQAASGRREPATPPGMRRMPSISWRAAGWECGLSGGVSLVYESDHACPYCRGSGEVPGGGVCPVCAGRKTVHVHAPSVRCAFCGGQGQMPPRSHLTCWVCKGKGLVHVRAPARMCPDCQGKGKRPCESLYCPRCRGVGAVAVEGTKLTKRTRP